MEEEIWKVIDGYPDYRISNMGRIKSFKRNKEKDLKVQINKNGYSHIILSNNGLKKIWRIHRLVSTNFNPTEDKTLQVNHINGIKHDNRLCNLEWVTMSENMKHSFDVLGRIGNETGKYLGNHNTAKKIVQYSKDGLFIRTWDCVKEAAIEIKIHCTGISKCLSGEQRSSGGFKWKDLDKT